MSLAELAVYDIPFTGIEDTMIAWVEEALELRHGEGGIEVAQWEDPRQITAVLVNVRTRSDRVDQLLANITRARGRVRRAQDQARFQAEQAFATAASDNKNRRGFDTFISREERKADADLASIEQRRLAHQAERVVSVANECWDVINQIHWQLDSIRTDLRTQINSLRMESSLER